MPSDELFKRRHCDREIIFIIKCIFPYIKCISGMAFFVASVLVFDGEQRGLGVRATAGGSKTYLTRTTGMGRSAESRSGVAAPFRLPRRVIAVRAIMGDRGERHRSRSRAQESQGARSHDARRHDARRIVVGLAIPASGEQAAKVCRGGRASGAQCLWALPRPPSPPPISAGQRPSRRSTGWREEGAWQWQREQPPMARLHMANAMMQHAMMQHASLINGNGEQAAHLNAPDLGEKLEQAVHMALNEVGAILGFSLNPDDRALY
jgi:hypothetical protein